MRFASLDAPQSLVDYKNINPQLFTEAIAGHDKDTNAVLDTTANAYNQILQDGTLDPDTKQQRLAVVRDNIANLYKQHDGNIGMARPAIMDYFQKEYSDPYWQADKQMFDKHKALMDETNKLRSQGESVIYRDQNGQIVDNPAGFYKPYDEFGNLRNPAEVNLSPEKVINGYKIADEMFAGIPLDTTDAFGEGSGSIKGYIEEKKKGTNVPKINHFMDKALQAFVANGGQQYLELNGEKKTRELLDAMAEKHKQTTVDNSLHEDLVAKEAREHSYKLDEIRAKQVANKASGKNADGSPRYEYSVQNQPVQHSVPELTDQEYLDQFKKLSTSTNIEPQKVLEYMKKRRELNQKGTNAGIVLGGRDAAKNNKAAAGMYRLLGVETTSQKDGETITYGAPLITREGKIVVPTKNGSQIIDDKGNVKVYLSNGKLQSERQIPNDELLSSKLALIKRLNLMKYGGTNPSDDIYKATQETIPLTSKEGKDGQLYQVPDYTVLHQLTMGQDGKLQDYVEESFSNAEGIRMSRKRPLSRVLDDAQQEVLSYLMNKDTKAEQE